MKTPNPLDHKPAKNQFAGSKAKPNVNAWNGVFKGRGKACRERNRVSFPTSRLSIVWRSMVDGVNMIESLLSLSERSFTARDPIDTFQELVDTRVLGSASTMLLDFLTITINHGVEGWSNEHENVSRSILRSVMGLIAPYHDNEFVVRFQRLIHGRDITTDPSKIHDFDGWIQSRDSEAHYEDLLVQIMKTHGHGHDGSAL